MKYYEKYKDNWLGYLPEDVVHKYKEDDDMLQILHNAGGLQKHGDGSISRDLLYCTEIKRLRTLINNLHKESAEVL